jgi:hypothetical protein
MSDRRVKALVRESPWHRSNNCASLSFVSLFQDTPTSFDPERLQFSFVYPVEKVRWVLTDTGGGIREIEAVSQLIKNGATAKVAHS